MVTKEKFCLDLLREESEADWLALNECTRKDLLDKWYVNLKMAHTPAQTCICIDMIEFIKGGEAIE